MEVLSLCPFRAGALAWQSAPNAWSLTVVVKATFMLVVGGESTVAPVQIPVAAYTDDSEAAVEDLSPLKPRVDVLVLRGQNEDTASVEVSSCVLPARGPIPPYAPARRLQLRDAGLNWAASVLRGEAASAGPVPDGFDFGFFHMAPRDQRIDLLRTGSPLVLNHVLADHARFETILPQRKPQAFRIHPQTGKASEIILRCDTLCIDAARNLFVLTFRGITDVDTANLTNMGTIVVAAHSAGKKIRPDRIERFLRNGEPIEGESNDGRHPLEKRYDTVLVTPKGDTMALPELDGGPSGIWQAAQLAQSESSILRAGGGLPFQSAAPETPQAPVPPAPLNAPVGGRRRATLASPAETQRNSDMPFQGSQAPPVPEPHMPRPPPEGIFPPPPALLGIAAPPEAPPLIRPPPMLGKSFAQDEKTADLPPGHEQPEESPEERTAELPPLVAATAIRPGAQPPPAETPQRVPVASGLAGKPAPTAPQSPQSPKARVAAPSAPKAITILGMPQVSKPPATVSPAAAAPKPAAAAVAAPKPATSAPIGPSKAVGAPVASPAAPKTLAPKAPIKMPAPLGPKFNKTDGPKLKTDGPAKPNVAAPVVEKKPTAVVPDKPSPAPVAKPAAPAKLAPIPPMRPMTATLPFPGMIGPDVMAAIAAAATPVKAAATPAEPQEYFNAADALTLEQCATLEAELRHRAPTRKTLLEKNKLSAEQWSAVHKHWSDAIARETEVGERKLLVAYDAAYVAVQERLGVDVGIDTHAKLQVAAERGTSSAVLGELGLEPADQMRIGRVWTKRLTDEPARMRELAAAIEKARAG